MADLITAIVKLIETIIYSAFSFWKQLTGIQNNFWAAALGVSPLLATVFIFFLKKIVGVIKH